MLTFNSVEQAIFNILEEHLNTTDKLLITYSDINNKLKAKNMKAVDFHLKQNFHILGNVSAYSKNNFDFYISAVIISKEELKPGDSYFSIYGLISYTDKEKLVLWAKELEKIVQHYKK